MTGFPVKKNIHGMIIEKLDTIGAIDSLMIDGWLKNMIEWLFWKTSLDYHFLINHQSSISGYFEKHPLMIDIDWSFKKWFVAHMIIIGMSIIMSKPPY